MAHDVFVSYSVKDRVVADAIVARLESGSIRCWEAPRDVVPGADWGESIINAIESSRIMILVFSSNANASPQIKREVERAVDKGVYIIPFRVDNIEPTRALEYFISTAQWMDAFPPPLDRHLDNLAETVKAILAGTPPPLPKSIHAVPPASVTAADSDSRPAKKLSRWLMLAGAFVAVGFGSWFFGHRPAIPAKETSAVTPVATLAQPSATLAPPSATISDRKEEDALAATQARESEEREAALKAQLAEAQQRVAKMQEEATRQPTDSASGPPGLWLFPDSSSRYLSRGELLNLSADQLWRARNEIYARNGYRFSSPRGIAFGQSLGANYRGVDPDDDRVFNRMNPYEQANVSLIRSLEQR